MLVSLQQACATRHSAGLLLPTRPPQRSSAPPEGALRITVVTPRKGRYELVVREDSTQEDLRQQLHEAKTQNVHLRPYHDPTKLKSREDVEMRILYKGIPMKSTLKQLGVSSGATLLALPELREPRIGLHGVSNAAPRGLLMTSNRAWKPSQARKPREALFITPEVGSYRANLVHPVLNPHPPLPMPS
ncbi:unnamed protein product [Cladocopium goreaui]|uniref:Ubiquitin-like domain-containing protein n=1 Tax=Cladocopium goreaui TaxID=2562237 RepID=A0A9P1DMH9_9DINO|nr:unnamed protein product [Cladocopium goreaui]|mmetsp:Transcript_74877/g.165358  ORF Transcript_74877/g.165358 Transcript_74877/m.165358 type:complete len:188 (-) Transcript_74877:102-665(-)